MYIKINNIKGKKTIDLSYSICSAEVKVVRMLSDNVQYEIVKPRTIIDPVSDNKKTDPI